MTEPLTIEKTLRERKLRYGNFLDHASITQALKQNMASAPKWKALSAPHREALEMIQHKIGRILNGDPNYKDNWHDIVGYATLAEESCSES